MKRPLIMVLVLWGTGLFLGLGYILFVMLLAGLFYFIYVSGIEKVRLWHILSMLSICLVSFLRILVHDTTYEAEKLHIAGYEQLAVTGTVADMVEKGGKRHYTVVDWVDSDDYTGSFKIKLISGDEVDIGDIVSIGGQVLPIEPLRNEGGFDSETYNRQKGFSGVVYGGLSVEGRSDNAYYDLKRRLYEVRTEHHVTVTRLLPHNEASILSTLLLGTGEVDDQVKDRYRIAGLIHLLAISGLHVSIIVMFIYRTVKVVTGIRVAAVIAVVFAVLYCLYTGMHTSTVRAVLMVTVYLFKYVTGRRYDPTSALGLVALILLLINPYQMMDIGFMLSFSAVGGIFYIAPRLEQTFIKGDGILVQSIRTIAAVQLAISPIQLYYFHEMPTYSLIANLLVMPGVPVVVIFGMAAIAIANVSVMLSEFLVGIVFWVLLYMEKVSALLYGMPFNVLNPGRLAVLSIVIYCIVLLFWIGGMKRRYVVGAVLMLVFSMAMTYQHDHSDLNISVMDVGQGDCAIINYKGRYILIDGGGNTTYDDESVFDDRKDIGTYVLLPYLKKYGVGHIDTIFISHGDYDHIYGIIELTRHMSIGRVVLPITEQHSEQVLVRMLLDSLEKETEILYMATGDSITMDELKFYCMSPNKETRYESINDASLVLLLDYHDFQAVFLGDVSKEQEAAVAGQMTGITDSLEVCKVAHHGSSTSSLEAFYDKTNPKISIVSVGNNNYGHPDQTVMDCLETYSEQVYATIDSGAVIIRTDGNKMVYRTMVNEEVTYAASQTDD